MYEKNPRHPTPNKKEWKASPILFIIIGVIIIIIASIVAYFLLSQNRETPKQLTLDECARTIEKFEDGKLTIIICARDDGSLFILWQNLPEEVKGIRIYQNDSEGKRKLVQVIIVSSPSGSTELPQSINGSFTYSFEATNETGDVLITQDENLTAPSSNNGTDQTSSTENEDSSQTPIDSGSDQPTDNSTSTEPSGDESPPNNSAPSGEEAPTGTIYYTPEGQISGTADEPSESFWVTHINKKIEIGWRNLPSETTKMIVYRSPTETSDYDQFFQQINPEIIGPTFIRLDDHTIDKDYYYKLTVFNESSPLESYGPIFLPGITN